MKGKIELAGDRFAASMGWCILVRIKDSDLTEDDFEKIRWALGDYAPKGIKAASLDIEDGMPNVLQILVKADLETAKLVALKMVRQVLEVRDKRRKDWDEGHFYMNVYWRH